MKHLAVASFWRSYAELTPELRELADKNFALLKADPNHPSLRLKRVGRFWSARVGRRHRALAVESGADLVWVWIGDHTAYERLIGWA